MRIEHIAIWTKDLERLKNFYTRYFAGIASLKYTNEKKQFQSYFIRFELGARLELMQMPNVAERHNVAMQTGLAHLAFSVGSREAVDQLTELLRMANYPVVSEPRTTGDGYYESCVLDDDGNRIEITI